MPYLDPSIGLVRDLVLVLDAVVISYCLLYVFYLVLAWTQGPVRRVTDIRLGWAIFLAGTAFRTFCFLQGDIYAFQPEVYAFWVKLGTVAMMIALVGFFEAVERIIPHNTRHAVTLLGASLAIIAVFTTAPITKILSFGSGILAFIVMFLFFQHLRKNITDVTRLSYRLVSVGILAGYAGFLLHLDEVYYYLGPFVYIGGILILLFGTILFGASVMKSPAYDEMDWIEQLDAIYVIGRGGALLFSHEFQKTGDMIGDLAAAGLTGIEELMREITGTDGSVNTISIGEYDVLFAHGHLVVTALVCRAPYRILLEKCREFTEQYELVFGDGITHNVVTGEWNQLTKKLVNSIFIGVKWKSETALSDLDSSVN